jgi:hypothetical protein
MGAFRHRNGACAFGAWSRRNEEERAIREARRATSTGIPPAKQPPARKKRPTKKKKMPMEKRASA